MAEDDLFAYLLRARAAGDTEAAGLAVAMLVWGLMRIVRYRVTRKIPVDRVDEVAESVLLSALTSDFSGGSVGEFRSWLNTIIQRRVADFLRDPRRSVALVALPTQDDESWLNEPSVEFAGDAIDAQRAVARALDQLNATHREVVELNIFEDLPADEVAARCGVSPNNVHKIVERFRKALVKLLEDDTST